MKGAIMLSGGGSGKLFAAIGVTYPAGSTLTCTNGTKTLKAKTTSGQWVFAIPEAGTWTVTATQGTNTKNQSVSITKEGQFESVELAYLEILLPCAKASEWTGRNVNSNSYYNKHTIATNSINVFAGGAKNACAIAQYGSAKKLNSNSVITVNVTNCTAHNTNCQAFIFAATSNSITGPSQAAASLRVTATGSKTLSIEQGGNYYVGILAYMAADTDSYSQGIDFTINSFQIS